MDKRGNISSRNMRIFAAIMTLIEALVLTSLTGCADKKVDYGTDTEKMTKSSVCNVKDFSTEATYSDEFSVQTEIGNVNIDISAKVELPDCKTMSVVEVEKIPYSAKLKEKVLKAYFGESQIYYYDKEHWTKTQLQNLIDSINSSTTPTDTSGTGNRAEFLKEYTHYLENAGDEWTIATEYDSCDEFVGKKGNTWYNVNFVADGDANKWLSGIGAGPIEEYTKKAGSNEYEWSNIFNDGYVQQYFGPDSLMEYDTVNDITDSQDTSGEKIEQEENESGITIEEAGNMIDSFLKETGFSSIPQTESSQLKWSGYNERADHVYQEDDIHECVSGYRFYYNIGVGKILFDDALNPMDYSGYNMKYGDSIEDTFDNEFYNFYIDKYGIGTFYIDCPVSIVRKQENVEMLPLENIFDIARDELKNNADKYVLDTNVKYYTLKLAYIRVNNRTDMQKYSYIPAWSLELQQKGTTNACPVFINAIDGSVIHPDDVS